MLTIFTTAKPHEGLAAIHQRNALNSWRLLRPEPEILVIGDEPGTERLCDEVGARHITGLGTNERGIPLVSHLFELGQRHASNDVVCFINADIVLLQDAMDAVVTVAAARERFLVVARRWDLHLPEPVDFGPGWEERLRQRLDAEGRRETDLAIDWFVFRRGAFTGLPPFAIARTSYDNWLLWRAVADGCTLVDASAVTRLVHQHHDYGYAARGRVDLWAGADARAAAAMLGHWSHYFTISHATEVLTADGRLSPALGLRYRLARPRRRIAHALRFTRPARLRLRRLRDQLRRRTARDATRLPGPAPAHTPVHDPVPTAPPREAP